MTEEGPENWFRCICVVEEVSRDSVRAYCVVPNARDYSSGDVHTRLSWNEFDTLGVKSKFVAVEMPSSMTF